MDPSEEEDLEDEVDRSISDKDVVTFQRLMSQHPELRKNRLFRMASRGHVDFVRVLLDLGVDPNEHLIEENPNSALYQPEGDAIVLAAGDGNVEIVRMLLDHGAKHSGQVRGVRRSAPLLAAARMGRLDVVKLLIERGADPTDVWNGKNVLMEADIYGQKEVSNYLRSIGLKDLRETTTTDFPASHRQILKLVAKERGPVTDWSVDVADAPGISLHATEFHKIATPGIDEDGEDDGEDTEHEPLYAQTIFTLGVSDQPIQLPEDKEPSFLFCVELSIMLPKKWSLSAKALADPKLNWPIEGLKKLSREIAASKKWGDFRASVFMNGDPPQPLAPNTALCGWLALAPPDKYPMPDSRAVSMYHLFPIYAEEQSLIKSEGYESLLRRFMKLGVPRTIDPNRKNVAK